MSSDISQEIRDGIIKDIEQKFGWNIYNVTPNYLGYGNLKWFMETDHIPIFVKQYNKVRYRRGLEGVRNALKYQNLMHAAGIPCQPVIDFKGEYIHTTTSEESYMITGFSTGKLVDAGKANNNQMYSLGEATGRMHKWMQTNLPRLQSLQWELPSKEQKFDELQTQLSQSENPLNSRCSLGLKSIELSA